MCRASGSTGSWSRSDSSSSSTSSAPSAWYTYFSAECLKQGVQPETLIGGGRLIDSLRQDVGASPSLRLRERAWMQLTALQSETDGTGDEAPLYVSASRGNAHRITGQRRI